MILKLCRIALLLSLCASASADNGSIPLYKGAGVEVNMLSDFEAGTRFYERGDLKMAITMFKQGVEKGDPKAMFALGSQYYLGEGIEKDLAKARELFKTSSSLGNAESAYMLSLIYGRGDGVPADEQEALKHLHKAALGCVAQAQSQLAQMYYKGLGVAMDKLNGIAWLAIAVGGGDDKDTQATVKDIKAALSPADRERLDVLEQRNRSELTCPKV